MLTGSAPHDPPPIIHRFQELPNHKRHRLDPLHLLLCPKQFSSKVVCFIPDVFLYQYRISSGPATKIRHLGNIP